MGLLIDIVIYAGIVFMFFSCVYAIGYLVQKLRTKGMTPEEKKEFIEKQKREPICKSRMHKDDKNLDDVSPNITGNTMSMRMDQM